MFKIWRVGVTGGIGSGKSNVLRVIQTKFHVPVIDADMLGHQSYAKGTPAYIQVLETFGSGVLANDGEINRKALGGLVFGDQNKGNMKKLTDIVWPYIAKLAMEEIGKLESKGEKLVVLEGAVIVEAGWTSFMDELWVTEVPPEVAKGRIMKRNNISAEEAEKRISSQISNTERAKHATVVIDTNRPIEETNEIVIAQFNKLLNDLKEHHSTGRLAAIRKKGNN